MIFSAVFAFVVSRFSGGIGGFGLAGSAFVLGTIWLLVVALQSLIEPMLVIAEDGIMVRRWGSQLLHVGEGRRYPPQALDPVELVVRGGRGGRSRVVQLSLSDYSGVVHRFRFFFITLENFQNALAQSR